MADGKLGGASAAEEAQLLAKLQRFAEDTRFEEADLVEAEFHRQFGGGRIKGGDAALGFSHDGTRHLTRLTFSNEYFGALAVAVAGGAAAPAPA